MAEPDVVQQVATAPLSVATALSWAGGALGGVAAFVIAPLVRRVVKKHDEEIEELQDGLKDATDSIHAIELAMPSDYVRHETWEQNRQENRQAQSELHRKVEGTAKELRASIEQSERDAQTRHNQVMGELLKLSGAITRGK